MTALKWIGAFWEWEGLEESREDKRNSNLFILHSNCFVTIKWFYFMYWLDIFPLASDDLYANQHKLLKSDIFEKY